MSRFLYENHRGSPTLTLLNLLGVLNALHVLNVLYVLHVLHVLNMLMDASLACWALLDASSHLYMRSCPTVCRMVGWSDGWSVRYPFF